MGYAQAPWVMLVSTQLIALLPSAVVAMPGKGGCLDDGLLEVIKDLHN